MKDRLRQILMNIDLFKFDFKEYCQDRCVDLENRWELFLMGGHLFAEEKTYIVHFKCLNDEVITCDAPPFYPDRGRTMYCREIVDDLIEFKEENDYSHVSKSAKKCIENLNIDDLKEEILEKFLWSFGYDW